MKWKTVARMAKIAAYVAVPGAAGYAAYRYVLRPWLDRRGGKEEPRQSASRSGHSPTESQSFRPPDSC